MTSEIREAGLTDANDQDPGIRRRKLGTGFSYVDSDGAPTGDAYLREALGEDSSANDFRTWAGSVAVAGAQVTLPACSDATGGKRNVNTCVKAVAGLLGNTPAILGAYCEGKFVRSQRAFELSMLRFLDATQNR